MLVVLLSESHAVLSPVGVPHAEPIAPVSLLALVISYSWPHRLNSGSDYERWFLE